MDEGWTELNTQCQIIQCGPPQPVVNGAVWPRGEGTYGQQADYFCDQGYTLTGEATINCTDTGHWSHPAPICTENIGNQSGRQTETTTGQKAAIIVASVAAVVVTALAAGLGV